jgi:hypothetical protein
MNLMMTLLAALHCYRRIFVWRSGAGRQSAGRSPGSKTATNDPDYTAKACLQGFLRNKPEALPKSEGGLSQGDRSQCKNRPGKLLVYFQTLAAPETNACCNAQHAATCCKRDVTVVLVFIYSRGKLILSVCRNAESVELNVHLRPLEVGMRRREGSTTERKKLWPRTKKF